MTGWKRGAVVALSMCAVFVGSARAEISVGAGAEYFRWKESTSPVVEETGLRWVFDLTWSQSKQPGPSIEYNVKAYVGKVDYDGALLFDNTPISSDTHYRGVQNELRGVYRTVGGADFATAFGWDSWRRNLSAAQRETYDVLYLRAGAGYGATVQQGVFGSAGAKLPFYVRENAHLTDIGFSPNPRLKPRGQVSLYGMLGYRFSPRWDVSTYYDSYRFRESKTVVVSDGTSLFGFGQPRSKQDQYGLKLQHTF
jgi:hypothetical protein